MFFFKFTKFLVIEKFGHIFATLVLVDLVLIRDKLVNLDRLNMTKGKIGWFIENKRFLLVGI